MSQDDKDLYAAVSRGDVAWINQRLRHFHAWPDRSGRTDRNGNINCSDMTCGADDCATCHPSARGKPRYDDSQEEGYQRE